MPRLTSSLTAYWIAFGPHGPRAEDPPGTNARVAWGVAAGLGVSVAIFATIRMFAKPPPHTMTKEYQEMSNEYLIVCATCKYPRPFSRANLTSTGTKSRPHHWSRVPRLHWQGHGPVSPQGQLKYKTYNSFPFVIEAGVTLGASALCETVLEEHGIWWSCVEAQGDSVNTVLQGRKPKSLFPLLLFVLSNKTTPKSQAPRCIISVLGSLRPAPYLVRFVLEVSRRSGQPL